jgi:ABC-2 type transport system ATP-binding protein
MNAIETHGLSQRYGRLEALHGLNLAVPAGSIFALLGPNGAGKSTTIKVLMNLLEPTAGSATVLGVDSHHLSPRELARIGFVADNMELPEWMTVRVFLDYCRPLYPMWDRDLENKLLLKFDLPADRKLKHLSRGMRMKAALIAALAYRPTLLVLDEPFSGLDPVVRDDFIRGVIEVSSLGDWTVFLSSHDVEEVERLADWIAVLEQGKLRFTEPLDSLLRRFRRIEITRTANAAPSQSPLPSAWLAAEEAGTLYRFIDSRYTEGDTERRCTELFPGAAMQVQPLPLREIYLTLARHRTATAEAIS